MINSSCLEAILLLLLPINLESRVDHIFLRNGVVSIIDVTLVCLQISSLAIEHHTKLVLFFVTDLMNTTGYHMTNLNQIFNSSVT